MRKFCIANYVLFQLMSGCAPDLEEPAPDKPEVHAREAQLTLAVAPSAPLVRPSSPTFVLRVADAGVGQLDFTIEEPTLARINCNPTSNPGHNFTCKCETSGECLILEIEGCTDIGDGYWTCDEDHSD